MQSNNTYKQNCKCTCRTKSEHKIIQLQSNENKPSLYHFLPFFFSSMKLIHLQAHFVYVRVNKYLQMINIKMTEDAKSLFHTLSACRISSIFMTHGCVQIRIKA